ncbi:helix-turn-helix domain-containing protein [Halalkalibacter nanhaiisediminis]|uniref:Helix-turn-helix protein n=1 Tax=Halalkalibacter nanhaiisediminis TaxID=688079 RepID=A0A562QT05_9BACI|nr:helix-turn-helix transcriptional regulator [Halalkalibacter nanhaiisediminis]TWI59898.1 helix-turn-helix protein [Halalkalibacter nanhaiisediminis]
MEKEYKEEEKKLEKLLNKNTGSHIRALRQNLDMTIEELAHEIKMDRSHLGRIERGEVTMSYIILLKISYGLGVKDPRVLYLEAKDEIYRFLREKEQ